MRRKATIKFLKKGHREMESLLRTLNQKQIADTLVTEKWTVKDVLAHLAAWNMAEEKAVDEILSNKIPEWWGLDETEFNRRAVRKRSRMAVGKVLSEWESSFQGLMARLEQLSETEWYRSAHSKGGKELSGRVCDIFIYRYKGRDHEGGHAKQARLAFRALAAGKGTW